MISNNKRKFVDLVFVAVPAKLGETLIGLQERLCRKPAHRHNNLGLDPRNLLVQKRAALSNLLPKGVTIVWRATLENIGYVDIFARESDTEEHRTQQSSRPAHKGQSLLIFLCAWRLADKKPTRPSTPRAEDGLIPRAAKIASLALRDIISKRRQRAGSILPLRGLGGDLSIGITGLIDRNRWNITPLDQAHFAKVGSAASRHR